MYCGNNKLNIRGRRVGSRHECLKRGVGIGLHSTPDPEYADGYEPIVDKKLYCGNKTRLPGRYQVFGTPTECLQMGVGIGKRMRYLQGFVAYRKELTFFATITFILSMLYYYTWQPSPMVNQVTKRLKWSKIIGWSLVYTLSVVLVFSLVIYFIIK